MIEKDQHIVMHKETGDIAVVWTPYLHSNAQDDSGGWIPKVLDMSFSQPVGMALENSNECAFIVSKHALNEFEYIGLL